MSAIWRNDYLRFRQGVEKRPDGMTLDRIDNDGHYEPGNVRWADRDTQSKNRRCVKTYNYDNKDLNITELSKKLSLPKSSLHRWLVYDKLSLQEVIQRKIP